MSNRRLTIVAVSAALLLAVSARHPSADIRVMTHDASDPAPHQVRAAVDMGVMAISILVTWTTKRLT